MGLTIYGKSAGAAYLAALTATAGKGVTWVTTGHHRGLRPALIRAPLVSRLRRFLARNGVDVGFLLAAPEHEGWRTSGARMAHRFRFRIFEEGLDRWVREEDLLRAFAEVAARRGAILHSQPSYPVPQSEDGKLVFADARDVEVPHWPKVGATPWRRWAVTEIHFARSAGDSDPASQCAVMKGCFASLLPHPVEGSVLSLASTSRHSNEAVLASLASAKGAGPRAWRALWLANPGAARRDDICLSGLSTQQPQPGIFLFGDSVGTQSPLAPWLLSESLDQAERLFEQSLDGGMNAEQWILGERDRYASVARRLGVWERCLGSERYRDDFLAVASFMPPALRDFLKTPL